MDVLWICLGIFCICLSLYMVLSSIYIIIKEKKKIPNLLTLGEKLPPWYTNSTIRKHVGLLNNGVLLAVATVGLVLFWKHIASALLVLSAAFFMYTCSRLVDVIVKEALRTRTTRAMGEEGSHWLSRSQFHQEIAIVIFLTGASMNMLFIGLTFIKMLTPGMISQIAWSWEILVFIGGLYWLTVSAIQIVHRKRRARSSL